MNCALSASAAVAMQTTTKSEAASTSAAAAAAAVSSSSSQKERKVSDATRRSLATTDFDVWKWTHEEVRSTVTYLVHPNLQFRKKRSPFRREPQFSTHPEVLNTLVATQKWVAS